MYKTPEIEKITILGVEVPVTISSWKCNKEEADGLYMDDRIYLRELYETKEYHDYILTHEAFHALCDVLGCQLDHNLEETLAKQIGKCMTLSILT